MDLEAARALALRLADRHARIAGLETRLLKAGRDGACVLLHTGPDGAAVVEKRISRLAAVRHGAGEAFFYRHIAGSLREGLLAPRPLAVRRTIRGARLFLEYVEGGHYNINRQAGELAHAIAVGEDETAARLADLGPRHRARLWAMTPLLRPARTRPRGGYPNRVGALERLSADAGLTPVGAAAAWSGSLRALERRIAGATPAIASFDLIKPNLRYRDDRFVALDWGAAAVAPRGYDLGFLIASLFRYEVRGQFERREGEAMAAYVGAHREARLDAARYAFLVHAADHVCGPIFAAALADPAQRPRAIEKLGLLVERLDRLDSAGGDV